MFLLIPILIASVIVADALHYRYIYRRRGGHAPWCLAWYLLTDTAPLIVLAVSAIMHDNTTGCMMVAMWVIWAWMLTALTRLVYFLFLLVRLRRTGIAVAFVLAATFLWGATVGRRTIHVTRVEVASPKLPAAFAGLRIAHISDLHVGTMLSAERELQVVVDTVNSLHPDMVIFTGDLVNIRSSELTPAVMRTLSGFDAPVYSVLGNHDVGAYIKDTVALPRERSTVEIIALQREMGWRVLSDESLSLVRGGDTITLSGIAFDPALSILRHDRDIETPSVDSTFVGVPASQFNITAVHLPQLWDRVRDLGYGDLTLSGHVHSMQMKLPSGDRGWSPAAWLYDRWSGRYDEESRTLYINDGIGCVGYPMRLGAWPEVTLITLRRCE